MTDEEKRQKHNEDMRKYNATPKGAAYNRKHASEWKKKNPTKIKKYSRHAQSGRTTSMEYRAAIIDFLIKRDGYICGFCKGSLETDKIQVDHIIPWALGRPATLENFRLAHAKCNLDQALLIRKQKHGY